MYNNKNKKSHGYSHYVGLLVRYETKATGCMTYIIDVGCLVKPSRLYVAVSLWRKALKLAVPGN